VSEADILAALPGENRPSNGSLNRSGRAKYRADWCSKSSNFQTSMYRHKVSEGGSSEYGQSSA